MDRGARGYIPWGPKESDTTERLNRTDCGLGAKHKGQNPGELVQWQG